MVMANGPARCRDHAVPLVANEGSHSDLDCVPGKERHHALGHHGLRRNVSVETQPEPAQREEDHVTCARTDQRAEDKSLAGAPEVGSTTAMVG